MITPPATTPRVLLVDNHPAVREALTLLLEAEGLAVCAHVETRAEAVMQAASNPPDLAVVDVSLGEDDGVLLVADLHAQGIPVVVCSAQEGLPAVRRALEAGARAYVAKRDAGTVLAHVLREVLRGWMLVSPRAAGEV